MSASAFTPPDPNFAVRVRGSFERQAAMRTIGATLTLAYPRGTPKSACLTAKT